MTSCWFFSAFAGTAAGDRTKRGSNEADACRSRLHGHLAALYESIMKYGKVTIATEYPVTVEDRYVMNPSPIPKYDNPRLHESECLYLFGAGREKKIYAIPPHTKVVSLAFDDVPFEIEHMEGRRCRLCGAENVYFDELIDRETGAVRLSVLGYRLLL